jgi:predicted RND superfamily exporter protein
MLNLWIKSYAHWLYRFHKKILAICAILVLVSVVYVHDLKINTEWVDLLPKDFPLVEEFQKIVRNFESDSLLVMAVEGPPGDIRPFAEGLVVELKKYPDLIRQIDYKLPVDFLARYQGLFFNPSHLERLKSISGDLKLNALFRELRQDFEAHYLNLTPAQLRENESDLSQYFFFADLFLDKLQQGLHRPGTTSALSLNPVSLVDPYYVGKNQKIVIMLVQPTHRENKYLPTIKKIVREYRLKTNPQIKVRMTGNYAVSFEELQTIIKDVLLCMALSVVLVGFLFRKIFKLKLAALLSAAPLVVGIVFTLVLTKLTVGSFNMITTIFGVILIGLGIDFSIQIMATFFELFPKYKSVEKLTENTFRWVLRGTLSSGLTTAAAFFALMIASFVGIKQFGFIVGSGIVLVLLANLIVLPALLIYFSERNRADFLKLFKAAQLDRKTSEYPRRIKQYLGWIHLNHGKVLLAAILITLPLLYAAVHVKFDQNMLHLTPRRAESIKLLKTLSSEYGILAENILVSATTLEETRQLTAAFKTIPEISTVDSIANYLYVFENQNEKLKILHDLARQAQSQPLPGELALWDINDLIGQVAAFEKSLKVFVDQAYAARNYGLWKKARNVVYTPEGKSRIAAMLENRNPDANVFQVLNSMQANLAGQLKSEISKVAYPRPITFADLPQSMSQRYIGRDGRFLITLIPKENVWNPGVHEKVLKRLAEISPKITGTFPLYSAAIAQAQHDEVKISWGAFFAIIILLYLDFKSLRRCFIALMPHLVSIVWLQGFMTILGIQFNIVNIMVIPLMLGVSLSYGIHLVHRYLEDGRHSLEHVFLTIGKPLLTSALTTIAALGTLLLASHRGLFSFGLILFIGVVISFMAAVVFTPALIYWMEKHKIKI